MFIIPGLNELQIVWTTQDTPICKYSYSLPVLGQHKAPLATDEFPDGIDICHNLFIYM